jgi:hypothetical protein
MHTSLNVGWLVGGLKFNPTNHKLSLNFYHIRNHPITQAQSPPLSTYAPLHTCTGGRERAKNRCVNVVAEEF